jgi:hypothetical protein
MAPENRFRVQTNPAAAPDTIPALRQPCAAPIWLDSRHKIQFARTMKSFPVVLLHLATILLASAASLPAGKPVPRLQAVPQPDHQLAFQRDGGEIARYHFAPTLHRPFLFPLVGPSGRALTRLGHPRDPEGHSHHNSVWVSHNDVNGVTFWGDRGTNAGRIIHQRIEEIDDGPDSAAVQSVNAWTAKDGKVLLQERRRTTVTLLPKGEWLLILDLLFEAKDREVTFGKTSFGLVGVRMAKTIGVNDGGGTIRNSEGAVDEKEVFWKPAKWVDYSGPVTGKVAEGVTLMDHPSNHNHPTVYHVRNDGWMGTALTFDAPRVLAPGKPLQLRYAIYVHADVPEREAIQKRWEEFAKAKPHEFKSGKK